MGNVLHCCNNLEVGIFLDYSSIKSNKEWLIPNNFYALVKLTLLIVQYIFDSLD